MFGFFYCGFWHCAWSHLSAWVSFAHNKSLYISWVFIIVYLDMRVKEVETSNRLWTNQEAAKWSFRASTIHAPCHSTQSWLGISRKCAGSFHVWKDRCRWRRKLSTHISTTNSRSILRWQWEKEKPIWSSLQVPPPSPIPTLKDRVAMQDASAQMAILQFMLCGRARAAVPSSIHCDHLIQANLGAKEDLLASINTEREIYQFLQEASEK